MMLHGRPRSLYGIGKQRQAQLTRDKLSRPVSVDFRRTGDANRSPNYGVGRDNALNLPAIWRQNKGVAATCSRSLDMRPRSFDTALDRI